jgi:hypothetical protein
LVLDLARVDQIDAGGQGVLLDLREWTRSNTIRLKLMNVTNRVLQIVELTGLVCVFEFCSVEEMFHLLYCAPLENTAGRRGHPGGFISQARSRTWLGTGSG